MKKLLFFIILAITAQVQAQINLNKLMIENSMELGKSLERMDYLSKRKESPEAKIEDHCQFREATRQHIKVLNRTYEIIQLMKKRIQQASLTKN
ncbi:hypothetical protein [Acinetobacter sp. NIPH 298]|uniref:hypothetical protein n=1 Tax=Acinetobacter sp. NIPH 298 TaxID=1217692 RepID=UPI0002CE87E6|nr:hypothetical protein [Acinetobacter sp. NIPH 298]ENW94645.1 hypothetical protein F903_02688 [Acinetobacter sp. NIPH 298]